MEQFDLFSQPTSNELWLTVAKFPAYQISDLGRIRKGDRILTIQPHDMGYSKITLTHNGKYFTPFIHRLVALAFLPTPPSPSHTQVNHINKIRTDNRASNLKWSTPSENMLHAKAKSSQQQVCF